MNAAVPAGVDDPTHPSGGNTYDRRVLAALPDFGWMVREFPVAGSWPRPSPTDRDGLAQVLAGLPGGSVLLVDGLIASAAPDLLIGAAAHVQVVVLLHMPLGTGGERELLRRSSAVITSSRWVAQRLVGDGLDPATLTVAEPGVDPAAAAIGSPAGGRFLAVGVVAPHKGHDLLVAALRRLADLDWSCTVAGALDVEPWYADQVRAAADGLAGRVRFAGPLVGDALARAYAAADLLIHPSRAETYGMVVGEALARAIPVVAADVGGVPQALGEAPTGERPGRLVDAGDVDAWTAVLRDWLTDTDVRRAWRRAAAARRPTLTPWPATARLVSRALAGVVAR